MLTLYMKSEGCQPCKAVKRWLQDPKRQLVEGVHYQIIDVEAPGADLSAMQDAGVMSVPYATIDGQEPFQGFHVDRLESWYASMAL